MSDRSAIEWTDATWNPIRARNLKTGKIGWHCEHASEGCRFCYAESFNHKRLGTRLPFKPGHRADIEIFFDEQKLFLAPHRWRRPRRFFVCSMTDLFGDWVPDAMIDSVFAVMALAPQHIFQVLTKRPARMRDYLKNDATPGRIARICVDLWLSKIVEPNDEWPVDSVGPIDMPDDLVMRVWPLRNLWAGTSCEDQATADARVPDLLATPAAVRFVSAEPLLGRIDFEPWLAWPEDAPDVGEKTWGCQDCDTGTCDCPRDKAVWLESEGPADAHGEPEWITSDRVVLDWIITGGESGPGERPMHPAWARSIRDQCAAVGVPFFFKQWGEWSGTHPNWPRAAGKAMATDGTLYDPVDLAYPDGARHGEAIRAGHDKAHLTIVYRLGKSRAGRRLDGVTHDASPSFATEGRGPCV